MESACILESGEIIQAFLTVWSTLFTPLLHPMPECELFLDSALCWTHKWRDYTPYPY